MKQKSKFSLFIGLITLLLISSLQISTAQKLEKYFKKGQYEKAYLYCENQENYEQCKACFIELANLYFEINNYKKATHYYERFSDKAGLEKIAEVYYEQGNYIEATKCYKNAGKYKEGCLKIADAYYKQNDYKQAIIYYEKAGLLIGDKYILEAQEYSKLNNQEKANHLWVKAGDAYLIHSNNYFKNNLKESLYSSLYISQDNKHLITSSLATIMIWDLSRGILLEEYGQEGTITEYSHGDLTVSEDNTYIATTHYHYGEESIKLWNFDDMKLIDKLDYKAGFVDNILISYDNKYLIIISDKNGLLLWDISKGRVERKFENSKYSYCANITFDNKNIVSIEYIEDKISILKMYDILSGKLVWSIEDDDDISSLAISRNNKYIIAGCDGLIKIFDLKTGNEIKSIQGHKKEINQIALTSNNNNIISASNDGTMKIWDFETGKEIRNFESGIIDYLTLSSDDKLIACSNADGTFMLWDINGGENLFKSIVEYLTNSGMKPEEAYLRIADYCFNNGNYLTAHNYYGKLNNIQQQKECYIKLVEHYVEKENYDHVILYYEKLGKHKEANLIIANRHFSNEEYKEAAKYYKKANAIDKEKECYQMLAYIALNEAKNDEDYSKAFDYFGKTFGYEGELILVNNVLKAIDSEIIYDHTKKVILESSLDSVNKSITTIEVSLAIKAYESELLDQVVYEYVSKLYACEFAVYYFEKKGNSEALKILCLLGIRISNLIINSCDQYILKNDNYPDYRYEHFKDLNEKFNIKGKEE